MSGTHNEASTGAAVAAFQRGELDRARSLAEEQLAKGDQAPLLHHLIGLIDCRLGRFDSGIESLKRAVEGDPRNIAYRIMLARALIDAGRPDEALRVAVPPGGTSSTEIDLWKVRAEAAFRAHDRSTEAAAWRAVCAARPRDVAAWTGLARSLFSLFRFAEAEEVYRNALALNPALILRHELGLMFEQSNQLDKLGALLDATLAEGIPKERLADLWALRALRSGDIDEAYRLAEMIRPELDPVRLYGLKAKIADAANRPDEAFAAASAMNGSVHNADKWRRRGRAYREELRAREKSFADHLSDLPRIEKSDRPGPVFLVGFPRSGTTLADTFLRGHPDVSVIEEVPILEMAAQCIGGVRNLRAASPDQLRSARNAYFAGLDSEVGPDFTGMVVDKMPLNMLSLPLIATLFPDARIIFAQRHPCDCVLSCFMQGFVVTNAMASFLDIHDAADLYDTAMRLFFQARDRLSLPVHTLVYEELVRDPEAVLRALTDFLGLTWDAEMLNHQETAARRSAIRTPSYDSVTQPLSRVPSGRWRRYRKQLEPVLPVLLPWAERLGYASGPPE
jgi:tetratricopeptide (TPR) repeat protein